MLWRVWIIRLTITGARVLIPTPFMTEQVLSDTQFGSITRPVRDDAMANWQEEGWKEAPVPVWNLLNYAVLQQERNGLALFTEGLREFEVVGRRKSVCSDPLRGVGVLGKEDLLLRPGRPSGIKWPFRTRSFGAGSTAVLAF